MHLEVLPIGSFEAIAPEWDSLALAYGRAPFMSSRFIGPLVDHFGSGGEVLVRASGDLGLVALGIFVRRRGMWETFQPSQLPIGALVLRRGTSLEQLLPALARGLPGLTLGVAATQQDPIFCERSVDAGRFATLDYIATAWVDVVGSFDDYWNARGKNLRQNLRKQRRKLADEGIPTRLEVLTRPEEVDAGIADYGALESASWKAGGGTAIDAANPQGRFYAEMMRAFCAAGRGMICRYRFGDKVVVVDLCIESDDTLCVLKTTYDESIRAYSPAALMREELFQRWWSEGRLRRIEFYGPAMEWHMRWTDHVRTMFHLNWYRWPALVRAATQMARTFQPKGEAVVQDDPG